MEIISLSKSYSSRIKTLSHLFVIIFLSLLTKSCSFDFKYPLQDFFLIEGTWKYKHKLDQKSWSINRKVLEKQEQDYSTWYKIEEKKQDSEGKKTSNIIWYSLKDNVILSKKLESDKPEVILSIPGNILIDSYEKYNDFSRETYEKSANITEIREKTKEGFPCPCLKVNTTELKTRGGSFSWSKGEKIVYAKNIGIIFYDRDSITNNSTKTEILFNYQVGKTRL